jgi:hypothetical protein
MALIAYDDAAAEAFRTSRHVPAEGLGEWEVAVARRLRPWRGMRVLDLGAGTGVWSVAFGDWFGLEMVAVEPAAAMRARSAYRRMVAGEAAARPLARAAWMVRGSRRWSTMSATFRRRPPNYVACCDRTRRS